MLHTLLGHRLIHGWHGAGMLQSVMTAPPPLRRLCCGHGRGRPPLGRERAEIGNPSPLIFSACFAAGITRPVPGEKCLPESQRRWDGAGACLELQGAPAHPCPTPGSPQKQPLVHYPLARLLGAGGYRASPGAPKASLVIDSGRADLSFADLAPAPASRRPCRVAGVFHAVRLEIERQRH